MEEVDRLVEAIRAANWKEREPLKAQLIELARGATGPRVIEHLETLRKGELLEVQWELEEVIEVASPKKPEPPKKAEAPPPEEPADPNRPLTAKDLVLVYDDGSLMLHKAKVGERWFATQFDQRSGQPQTFELHPTQVAQLKTQLAGSPYWVIGAAGVPAAGAPGGGAPTGGPLGAKPAAKPGAPGRPGFGGPPRRT